MEKLSGSICGGLPPLTKTKPRNWIEDGYRITVPYKFRWRKKIGSTKCTCKKCYEVFSPWYGVNWYHMDDCAILERFRRKPELTNLWQYQDQVIELIASSEQD